MTPDVVHPSQDDPVTAALSEVLGGPVGTRARGGRRSFAVAVLLALTSVTLAVGLASKTPCVSDQFQNADTIASRVCGTDLASEYVGTGLVELVWPWSDDPATRARYAVTEQPALVGLWTWTAARVTHVLVGSPDTQARNDVSVSDLAADPDIRRETTVFVAVNALGLALVALLVTVAVALTHRRRPWDAAGWALAPVLALSATASWDLLAVAAAAWAVFAWTRDRPVTAGWLIGLGAAAGTWPALLLVAFGVVALRGRRAADLLPSAMAATGVWLLANAPAFLSGRSEWERYWSVATERGPETGT
ncbi:MAG: glycosyltransferase 87 family protein, partial [Nocardioides sp.]